MIREMIWCVLAACGVLLLTWCLTGKVLLPQLRRSWTVLAVRGDAGALEQAVRAWQWMRGGGLTGQGLLLVDCGLDADGLRLARTLCAQDASVRLCTAQDVGDIIRLEQ